MLVADADPEVDVGGVLEVDVVLLVVERGVVLERVLVADVALVLPTELDALEVWLAVEEADVLCEVRRGCDEPVVRSGRGPDEAARATANPTSSAPRTAAATIHARRGGRVGASTRVGSWTSVGRWAIGGGRLAGAGAGACGAAVSRSEFPSAATTRSACCGRSSGALASICMTSASSAAGTSGRRSRTGCGAAFAC